jgi:hypothetical protein
MQKQVVPTQPHPQYFSPAGKKYYTYFQCKRLHITCMAINSVIVQKALAGLFILKQLHEFRIRPL